MRSIRFNDYSSLENCASEPIQFIGSIQSFGALIVLDKSDFSIKFASQNCSDFLNVPFKVLMSVTTGEFFDLFDNQFSQDDLFLLLDQNIRQRKDIRLSANEFILQITEHDAEILLELLPFENTSKNNHQLFDYLYRLTQKANSTEDLQEYCQIFCDLFRELIGYDRVMVYRFDTDYNGEVFAESVIDGKTPYLGLHYPHTDIPEQARELYKKVHLRIIADVNQAAVPMMTLNQEANHHSLYLGDSVLRSSSPIHLDYLKNMGVTATLTVSIMIDNRLWGLVACHHYSPRYAGIIERETALALTNVLSTQLHHWERSMDYAAVQEKEHIYQVLLSEALRGKDLLAGMTSTPYLTALTNSKGVAILHNNEVLSFGVTPDERLIFAIYNWMKANSERVFQSAEFSSYFTKAIEYSEVMSGILYYELDQDTNSAIMWFRPQLSEGVKWGGDPHLDKEVNGLLTPRKSFEAWQQEVKGKSEPWRSHEIQAGLRLGAYLQREFFIRNLDYQKERYKRLTAELQKANEELQQFNWISSHDMKEPLRKIRLFIDQIRLEGEEMGDMTGLYFSRIDAAANRMQILIDDLLNYAGLSNVQTFEETPIGNIVVEAMEELDLEMDVVYLNKLPILAVIPFQIRQLFTNLMSNSIKFSHSERPLKIEIAEGELTGEDLKRIAPESPSNYVKIIYRDNGIGFSPEFNEQIFQLFQRLHNQSEYVGTGIGLAICKKIVETHGGFITATGKEHEAAVFEIVLRK